MKNMGFAVSSSLRTALFVLTVAAFFAAPHARAIVIRHDQLDSDYLNLGAIYESVGRFNTGTAGTLIAAEWVLTAAHVAETLSLGNSQFTVGGSSLIVTEAVIHPEYTSVAGGNDIALIRLQTPVENVTPATYYTGNLELTQVGTSVGFGNTGTGASGAISADGQKRGMQNTIDLFGDGTALLPVTSFLSDFDNPGNLLDSTSGGPLPIALEGLAANGDSGGGVFIDLGSGPQLAGVHSYILSPRDGTGNSDYGDIMGSTRVSLYQDFIQSTIEPVPEPSVAATGVLGAMIMTVLVRRSRRRRSNSRIGAVPE